MKTTDYDRIEAEGEHLPLLFASKFPVESQLIISNRSARRLETPLTPFPPTKVAVLIDTNSAHFYPTWGTTCSAQNTLKLALGFDPTIRTPLASEAGPHTRLHGLQSVAQTFVSVRIRPPVGCGFNHFNYSLDLRHSARILRSSQSSSPPSPCRLS